MKKDMDSIEMVLKRAQKQLDDDFEKWYNVMHGSNRSISAPLPESSRNTPDTFKVPAPRAISADRRDVSTKAVEPKPPVSTKPKDAWSFQPATNENATMASALSSLPTLSSMPMQSSPIHTSFGTGDPNTDAEIEAFYKYRNDLVKSSPRRSFS